MPSNDSSPAAVRDTALIDAFLRRPGEETFAALFRHLAPQLHAYFRLRGCEPALAEDLVQETMLAVFRKAGALRQGELFRPWLYRIAKNVLLQKLRQDGRRLETTALSDEPAGHSATGGDVHDGLELRQWIDGLNAADRELILLRYVEGLEYHEIAALLETPMGTIQWRLFQARKRLAAQMSPAAARGAGR